MTNLSDFLKVKKVRLLTDGYTNLNKGSEYNLVRLEVVISNNAGIEGRYPLDSFEPVLEPAENPLQGVELTPEFEVVEPRFKVGDKVYVGLTGKIAQVTEIIDDEVVNVANKNNEVRAWISNICHATPENYERLQATFPGIKFEQPPKPLSGDELVRAMLTKGIKNVLCLWGSGDKIIIDRLDYKGSLMSTNCHIVGGLTPIDWYTGEPLTESVLND
ncbi:hypothetical protein OY033_002934 [Shigella flexneri]|nr:hypothetical protein [Shigella flexneri]